jgi:hypothetical protein
VNTRPLVIDDALKAECRRLREFAEVPRNWYVVGKTTLVPGDKPEYVIETEFGFRVVFTITHAPFHKPDPFRHMSISVPGDKFPHPVVVWTIAHHLGFTGADVQDDVVLEPAETWGVAMDRDERCMVVQQPYEEGTQ